MLFEGPELRERELEALKTIDELRRQLRWQTVEPRRWLGTLRRAQFARAVQGSNSIEGYAAPLDDAAAIDLGEEPLDASTETALAIRGYRNAMTFVLQLAADAHFTYNDSLLKSLHFMMTSYDLTARPGRWRAGPIFVRNDEIDEIVYEGPPVEVVPELMEQLVTSLNKSDESPAMVRGAMAHLNLVMIHPFRDGNGRMARCLQTLVLARDGILSSEFSSVEEYLGRNTQAYYDVLGEVGQGAWHPERSALAWIRFMLLAHLRQARTVLRRIVEARLTFELLDDLAKTFGLPERSIPSLYEATIGFRIRNSMYRRSQEDEISEQVASRDLKALVDARLLEPRGEKRGRYYVASPALREVRRSVIASRGPRDDSDPFDGLDDYS